MRTTDVSGNPLSSYFVNHLQAGHPVAFTPLYIFRLVDGRIFRWSGAEVPVWTQGLPFLCGPKIEHGDIEQTSGLQVDRCTLTIWPEESDQAVPTPASGPPPIVVLPTVGAMSLRAAIMGGWFDGADVQIWMGVSDQPLRYHGSAQETEALNLTLNGQQLTLNGEDLTLGSVLQSTWPLLAVLPEFAGRVAEIEGGGVSITIQCDSINTLLDAPVPGPIYGPSCQNVLYGPICRADKAAFTVTRSVTIAGDGVSFSCSGFSQADEYFRLGRLKWVTGKNAGLEASVQSQTQAGAIKLSRRALATPAVGDQFTISAGCDKTTAMCVSKFNNKRSFRGIPYSPQPETVL